MRISLKRKRPMNILIRNTNKTTKRRELKQQEKDVQDGESNNKRIHHKFIQESVHKRKIRNIIPGFSMIKNRIITPLLVASEKVIEYMIPDRSESNDIHNDKAEENMEDSGDLERHKLNSKFQRFSLEDIERKRKRVFKSLRKSNHNINISENLINKASD